MTARPIILVPACNREVHGVQAHTVLRQYVHAARLAGGQPLVVPTAAADEVDQLLSMADGVLLSGSPSNVHPDHFGEPVRDPSLPLDPERDGWTLPLARRAVELGVPLLGICRGAQEVNVALGGSLHQAVHEVPGYDDHRDDDDAPTEVQWGPSHDVFVEPGGLLAGLGLGRSFRVNSLHGQGVNRLAEGARVEARAQDGLVEAFTLDGPGWALCVQWHPEWRAEDNPVSMTLFGAFGQACSRRASERLAPRRG